MSRLYACIISDDMKQHRETLLAVAKRFTHSIETIEDGVLFDVRGLGRLMGTPKNIERKITAELKGYRIPIRMAVADTVETAILLARQARENTDFQQLPLTDLNIEQDTLNVFADLGFRNIKDLLEIPHKELIDRYGRSFQKVIDVAEQKGTSLLTPNIKESKVSWSFDLDQAVENFEQLIFVANHGLERLFKQVEQAGFSCEHLDLDFKLKNRATKAYEVRISFPTLERVFWLKLINLRVALDPPEADIVSISIVAYFSKARPTQRGLYAVSRPEPESLLLTVNKLKKLVGQENVGLPVLLDQRMSEPFGIDADALPSGTERFEVSTQDAVIGLIYYRPPMRVEVRVRDKRLVYLKCRQFAGYIVNCSGAWKGSSKWWDEPWRTLEWDIEVENVGVYRLCKGKDEWFLVGEYD